MSPNDLTDEQCSLMGDALGLKTTTKPYRNRFYASRNGHPVWELLERHGYAVSELQANKQRLYRVTWKGMRAVGLIGQDLRGLEGEELVDVPLLVKWRGRLK